MSETPELDALFKRQMMEFAERMRAICDVHMANIESAIDAATECCELRRIHALKAPEPSDE